jgi:hypothetical protein
MITARFPLAILYLRLSSVEWTDMTAGEAEGSPFMLMLTLPLGVGIGTPCVTPASKDQHATLALEMHSSDRPEPHPKEGAHVT